METEKYAEDDFDKYSGDAVIEGKSELQTDIIANENGLSGVVFDSKQNVDHAFVIDYKGEAVQKTSEIINTINASQSETKISVEKSDVISPNS
ncbi:hypothetical protein D3C74_320490 [compost metagenome]